VKVKASADPDLTPVAFHTPTQMCPRLVHFIVSAGAFLRVSQVLSRPKGPWGGQLGPSRSS
jgi:hypothetical protein